MWVVVVVGVAAAVAAEGAAAPEVEPLVRLVGWQRGADAAVVVGVGAPHAPVLDPKS